MLHLLFVFTRDAMLNAAQGPSYAANLRQSCAYAWIPEP